MIQQLYSVNPHSHLYLFYGSLRSGKKAIFYRECEGHVNLGLKNMSFTSSVSVSVTATQMSKLYESLSLLRSTCVVSPSLSGAIATIDN